MIPAARAFFIAAIAVFSCLISESASPLGEAIAVQRDYAAAPASLPIEILLSARDFGDNGRFAVSPDGQFVAYSLLKLKNPHSGEPGSLTRRNESTSFTAGVWITNLASSSATRICCDDSNATLPVWSPDSRKLAFIRIAFNDEIEYSRRATLAVWDAETKKTKNLMEHSVLQDVFYSTPQWISNREIAVRLRPASEPEPTPSAPSPERSSDPSRSTTRVFETNAASISRALMSEAQVEPLNRARLAAVDVERGTERTLSATTHCQDFSVSPNRRFIVFAGYLRTTTTGFGNPVSDLVLIDLTRNRESVIARSVNYNVTPEFRWSPNSSAIAFLPWTAAQRAGSAFLPQHFMAGVYTVSGGRLYWFSPSTSAEGAHVSPAWRPDASAFVAALDNRIERFIIMNNRKDQIKSFPQRTVVAFVRDRSGTHLALDPHDGSFRAVTVGDAEASTDVYAIDQRSGGSRRVYSGDYNLASSYFAADIREYGGRLYALIQRSDQPQDIFDIDPSFKSFRKITNVNPAFSAYRFGRSKLVRWRENDGNTLQGILAMPAAYDPAKRYPTIVFVYPIADQTDAINCFGAFCEGMGAMFNTQFWQTRGYAVFVPDFRVRQATRMADIAASVVPGVQKIIQLGSADPRRIGVFGQSQGGYTAIALAVQSRQFAAIAMASGYADYVSDFGSLDPLSGDIIEAQDLAATPWSNRARFIENSPIFFLDRVHAPVLIIHGTTDQISISQADEVFAGLRRLGKRAVYVQYVGESHSPLYYSYANQVDYLGRLERWFAMYLKPKL